jgi:hypothetical protein
MFKMQKQDTFKWPCIINVPKDGGGFSSHEMSAEFKLLEQSKIDVLLEQFKTADKDLLQTLLVGWTGVCDEEGNPMPFTDTSRDAFIDYPYVRTALLKGYFEATSGNKVKKGN